MICYYKLYFQNSGLQNIELPWDFRCLDKTKWMMLSVVEHYWSRKLADNSANDCRHSILSSNVCIYSYIFFKEIQIDGAPEEVPVLPQVPPLYEVDEVHVPHVNVLIMQVPSPQKMRFRFCSDESEQRCSWSILWSNHIYFMCKYFS
jgi:hypothetical protein